jgi:dolichol-phosphate mannosyltransferase
METPPRVLVVVATYNEIENLPRLVAAIHNALPQADLLVVDDHSPDGTGRWCDTAARDNPRLACLHRSGKLGLGSATVAGFEHALARDYDVVCTLDADFSHDPAVLPQLVAALDDADVAIGSRYVPGGTIEGWPLRRRVASRVMNSLSRWVLRLPARDTSGAFRAYRCAKLREIDLHDISSQGYAYLEEIVWLLARRGATFAEVPITFRERELGESKISINELGGKLRMLSRLAVRR